MAGTVNLREIILGILMEVTESEGYSHIVLRQTLEKYQYLSRHDRAFITRVTNGTLENLIQLDYIIECFSSVPIYNMKPLIRNLLRMSIYQLKYMESVPDSAVVNEAVRLTQKHGFYNLKGFVNGVLRNAARGMESIKYPSSESNPAEYLSVRYSMPQWILRKWLEQFSFEDIEKMCASFQQESSVTARLRTQQVSPEEIIESMEEDGATVTRHPYLDYAVKISGFNYLQALRAFRNGWIYVQDVGSMLAAEAAGVNWGETCIDVCAAPGGKSIHVADKLKGSGHVEARDKSESRVDLIQENIDRLGVINMTAVVQDAAVYDEASLHRADIVLCDVPCSGLGVIGRKPDIRYRMTPAKQEELIRLQKRILSVSQNYVKPGGVLIFSTCTVGVDENQMNLKYFLENFPFHLESIDPYIPEVLRCRTSAGGYIQLLPGVHDSDGFFIARLKRNG